MRAWCVLVLILLLMAPAQVWAAGFEEAPPTTGLVRSMAHTLHAGDLQIGFSNVLSPLGMHLHYGISDAFQIGCLPMVIALGVPNVQAKASFSLGENAALGVPLALIYSSWDGQLITIVGGVISASLDDIAFRGWMTLMTSTAGQLSLSPYGIVDLDVGTDVKVVDEVGLFPFAVSAGVLARFLDSLDIRAGADLIPFSIRLGVDWTISLRGGE